MKYVEISISSGEYYLNRLFISENIFSAMEELKCFVFDQRIKSILNKFYTYLFRTGEWKNESEISFAYFDIDGEHKVFVIIGPEINTLCPEYIEEYLIKYIKQELESTYNEKIVGYKIKEKIMEISESIKNNCAKFAIIKEKEIFDEDEFEEEEDIYEEFSPGWNDDYSEGDGQEVWSELDTSMEMCEPSDLFWNSKEIDYFEKTIWKTDKLKLMVSDALKKYLKEIT